MTPPATGTGEARVKAGSLIIVDALDRGWSLGGVTSYIDSVCRALPRPAAGSIRLLWPASIAEPTLPGHVVLQRVRLPRVGRRVGRLLVVTWLALRHRPRYWLSLTTILPLWWPRGMWTGLVVHDVRHLDLPSQFTRAQRWWRSAVWNRSLRRADVIVAISRFTHSRILVHLGVLDGEIVEVPHGVDGGPQAAHSDVREEDEPRIVLAFGHWEHKRPDWALEVFARFVRGREGPSCWDLVVLGVDAPRRDDYLSAARRLGIDRHVRILDYLDDADYQQLWTQVAVVLLPSMYEGFGLPVIEALARGLPVVSWRATAVAELGHLPGVHLARPWNLEELTTKLAEALDPAARGDAIAGQALVTARTWETVASELLSALVEAPDGAVEPR
jgi:glycosyltransferase involved in cell wall biosynthesis